MEQSITGSSYKKVSVIQRVDKDMDVYNDSEDEEVEKTTNLREDSIGVSRISRTGKSAKRKFDGKGPSQGQSNKDKISMNLLASLTSFGTIGVTTSNMIGSGVHEKDKHSLKSKSSIVENTVTIESNGILKSEVTSQS